MPPSPILIIGNGQIGSALMHQLGARAVHLTRKQLDLATADAEQIYRAIADKNPKAVINAAAYTAVDTAEGEGRDLAFRINGQAVGHIATACKQLAIPLVHYSTDYVFDGSTNQPFTEQNMPAPINAYGESKLEGDKAILQNGGDFLIFCVSWVYDETGNNFINTMLRLGAKRETLTIVADQIGAPCYAGDIARWTLHALDKACAADSFASGIYHLAPKGETSWHGFAEAIFEEAKARGMELAIQTVQPIPTSEYPTPAKRPLNSRLGTQKFEHSFDIELPHWREGLKQCLINRLKSSQ